MTREISFFRPDVILEPDDTPDTLAKRIHELEYKHFPVVVEELAKGALTGPW